jgi:hypothetical protein
MWLRLVAEGRGAASSDILVGYVVHGENSFLGDPAHDMMDDLRYLLRKHGTGTNGLDVDAESFGRWVAFRLRRGGRRGRAARLYLRNAREYSAPLDVLRAGFSLVDGRLAEAARAAIRGRARDTHAEDPLPEPEWLVRYR